MSNVVYTISAPAPIDAEDTDLKHYQPTGWCYVCGAASWVWDQSGPLCPSHANALDEYTNACAGFGCVDGCGDCVPPTYALVSIPGVELPAVPFGCEWCFITHDAQHCPAIRAVLFADDPPVDIPDEPYPPTPGGPEPPEWRTN